MIRFLSVLIVAWAWSLATPNLQAKGRPVVAVAAMQVATANVRCRSSCRRFSEGFRAMLETAIVKSRKMRVFERGRLDAILAEQGLAQQRITRSGGRIGGLTGVDYLVYGTITKFGARRQGFSTGGLSSVFGGKAGRLGSSIATSKASVEMAVDLKVSDVKTGRIVIADSVGGTVTTGEAFSIGGISSSSGSADPYADVQRVVAARISEAIVTSRIPIKVIKVQKNGSFVLNYGNVFLKEGDRLSVFDVGERIVDPDTGEVLGSEESFRGSITVTRAHQKFSRARFTKHPFEIRRGDVVRRPSRRERRKHAAERKRSGVKWETENSPVGTGDR